MAKKLLVWFGDVDKEDIRLVGGKGANLGEMTRAGFPVPPGFIVTSEAFHEFLQKNDLLTKIHHLLGLVDYVQQESLEKISRQIEQLIKKSPLSEELVKQVFSAYSKLGSGLKHAPVAIRSSATAEDLPTASFAGQQETFLNVVGEANVLLRLKDCWASLFHPRAIFYRHEHAIDEAHVGIAVPIQKMIESESSGILFSIDPVTNNKEKVIVEAIYGLGEMIVQGEVTPDHYEVEKKSLAITYKKIASQKKMLVKKGYENREVHIASTKQDKQKITDEQIIALAELSKKLEKHYYFPQDSEWAIEKGKIYLVQTRPVTTTTHAAQTEKTTAASLDNLHVLLAGDGASPGIATGAVKILESAKEIYQLKQGEVLVADETNPDYVPAMKKAVAIVTNKGGRTSHAAIVAREIGIPAVVGAENATAILKNGDVVTVNGLTGNIYKGSTRSGSASKESAFVFTPVATATKVYVNLAEPELAARIATKSFDGVGLLRAEFMMAGIGVHPKKMIEDGKSKEYIEKLADGIGSFAKAFSPRPVVYRTSDFKTNEYRKLVGGTSFEPQESNPMLGLRGAYRYIQDSDVFHLELEAIKQVRNKMGYKNVWLMLPFVRTVAELQEVKSLIAAAGLYRSPSFKIWMMVEIPSNVILLDKFIEQGIDGVSIGSNDLTMLMLGTDRDNHDVAKEFDEQNDTMLWAYEHVIKTAHKFGVTSSLCGQAASVYPSLLQKLVSWGITSVSISPDALEITRNMIAKFEKDLTK
ncbi:MAG TPA: phosphoenolpyruvate synthase [Patescibacteria group bacterium]|nr:phosphoenolpyruvate synthase [Patescibacteria group bacterium]